MAERSFDPLADALEQLSPSLVTVFGRDRQPASGILFDQGLILTADHVLEREEGLTIRTEGGEPMEAIFVGRDVSSDLAVLRVEGLAAPAATVAERARVGQLVLAVGRPWGEVIQASLGTVSVIGGPMRIMGRRRARVLPEHLITDAIPYPGFSGGALLGANGLLGILTTGLMRGATTAIPAPLAWRIGNELAAQGRIRRGYLGITSQPVELHEAQREAAGQSTALLIVGVEPGSPAASGGILIGDLLISLDGESVTDASDLQLLLSGERVGRASEVVVLRGSVRQSLSVTVAERESHDGHQGRGHRRSRR